MPAMYKLREDTASGGYPVERMIRKQVYIDSRHDAQLKRLVRERGVTEAQIIREALELYDTAPRLQPRNLSAWESERRFIEDRVKDGAPAGSRTWSREDLHER